MAPPQWIHCNHCYYLFSRKDRKFYQTSCLHVLCRNCTVYTNRGQSCPICQRQGLKFHEIANEMDPKEKALYNPEPFKPIEAASKSIIFQMKQKKHLILQLGTTGEKLHKADQMEQQMRAKIVDYQRKFDKCREQRKSLQEAIRQSQSAGLSPESAELLLQSRGSRVRPPTQGQSNSSSGEEFFDSDRQSRRSRGSQRSRDSFLDMRKDSSTSSDSSSSRPRSVDFGSTPSSNVSPSAGRISDQLHRMQIKRT
ncbi:hypothetical protein quinque_003836 [Culex quinquefasciatus]|uniref:RING finger protein narya n=1 Tax=Culex quinquefasciatus TaxID=7176 RepID=UPI0018E37591|nr:RING finger protein narya [Culex quinquefasciatus]